MSDVAARLSAVRAAVAAACDEAGRDPASVRLVAVSKAQPATAIALAYGAGQRDFGESYAQELLAKREVLDAICPEIRWHFIGRVQRNKAAVLAGTSLVHGVSSREHAAALGGRRPSGAPLPVLLQVNAAGEGSKGGFLPADLRRELPALLEVEGVDVRGLMTIPPPDDDPAAARRWFAGLRTLRDELAASSGRPLPELSMGMSGDFREAILEGATLVRVGTAIFGARPG